MPQLSFMNIKYFEILTDFNRAEFNL